MNNNIERVAAALLIDYTSVYYVDINTGYYECYSTNSGYKRLELQTSGQDFFSDCRRDIKAVVYESDWEKVSRALTKESIIKQLQDKESISVEYRLMIDGEPKYHVMKILYDSEETSGSIILGVQNFDNLIYKSQVTQSYNAIAKTLANRYATIYYIDLDTNSYVEYSSSNDYKELEVPPEGADFFTETGRNVARVIHPDDTDLVMKISDKEYMMSVTQNNNKFQIEYKLLMSDGSHHVRLAAVRTEDGNHLIVALENIDKEIQSKEEFKTVSENSRIFLQIAERLASQYGMIYYIDADTDEYIEFTATDAYRGFNIKPEGNDFFGESQRNVSIIIHPDDREKVFNALDKKNMLQTLEQNDSLSLTYQLMLPDGSSYTRMSVFWANDHKHLIMAIMNIDSEIQKEKDLKKTLAENATFFQIATSLANQYDTIYYVDMLNDHYIEFSSTDVYKSLDVRPSGDNFFRESLTNIDRVIHPDDRDELHRILNRTGLIRVLQEKHMITHTYRLLVGEGIMYARLSIIWATDNKHLIIGVMNIDQEVKKEQEIQKKLSVANEKAYRDEMTGVKNKAAFTEYEDSLQEQMDMNESAQFSVVVCDVNGLKAINDKLGHIEGDKYIKKASALICNTWTHSPVFRIGGDEFAVVLQGSDYENREALMEQIKNKVRENKKNGEVIVAVGMTDYIPGTDLTINEVFERADNLMYENKTALKKD